MDSDFNNDGGDVDGGGGANSPACTCSCSCLCCGRGFQSSPFFPRPLKRKLEQIEEDARTGWRSDVARVEIEIEAAALREALTSQHQSMQDLYSELEEERAAASTAASEAMSMILRLQREKSEAQMESRQFKRLAEEKMSHDQNQIALLEHLLFKRDQAVQSLSCEVQAYRHRLFSYGVDPTQAVDGGEGDAYSPLCSDFADPEPKYVAGDGPRCPVQRTPSVIMEKGVICNGNEFPERASGDDMGDRVYTVDAGHGINRDMSMPRELSRKDADNETVDEGEVKRLYTRLQELEADRESMLQAIMTMGMDKTQKLLYREIAQQLCKDVVQEKKIVKKHPSARDFSIKSVFKWVASLFFWRTKSSRIKYPFGSTNQMTGLLVLLDQSQRKRLKRCLTRLPM